MPISWDFVYSLPEDSQVEIRCIKLDSWGSKILGECTLPDICTIKTG